MKTLPDKNNDKLSELFNSNQLENPTPGFTNNIMNSLGIESSVNPAQVKPIIPFLGWIIITLTSLFIVSLAIIGGNNNGTDTITIQTGAVMHSLGNYFISILQSSTLLYATILSLTVFVLFCAEGWYRNRQLKSIRVD